MSTRYISAEIRQRIQTQAGYRCGYCQAHQRYVLGPLEIDHIVPVAAGGTHDEMNLWLACRMCNNHKGTQTHGIDPFTEQRIRLFNPRQQAWSTHFMWDTGGELILGITPCGRITVIALQLNNVIAINVRRAWISAGWHPPQD